MFVCRCVGVWDTVGAVFNIFDALSIKDNSLPPIVDHAFHALSLQENRQLALPTLWAVPATGLAKRKDGTPQVLKQVQCLLAIYSDALAQET